MNHAIDNLKALTNCKHILLTESGDHAIMLGIMACRKLTERKKFLIPDQGGWFSYKKYPKRLGFEVVEVKTDYGIVDLADLKSKIKDAAALIYTNPAGYFAEQPAREIYSLCKDKCLVIKDISGCIGDEKLGTCKDADFVVCSFNVWKPINLGYGGFIGTNSERFFSEIVFSYNEGKFDEKYLERLIKLLENLPNRMKMLYEITERVKRDLRGFKIIHPEKKGINVVVRFDSDEEKARILEYCSRNSLEFTLCPRYIRVNEKAVSVEVKRMK